MLKTINLLLIINLHLLGVVDYEKYCSKNSLRDTHIIIDLHQIDKLLYGQVIKNLKYAPHEHVIINAFDGNTNTLKLVYEFCYPKYSKKEADIIKEKSSILRLGANKLELMQEDQMFIEQKITQKLANLQRFITDNLEGKFLSAFESYSQNINSFGRFFVFTKRPFDDKRSKLNLKGSVLTFYQKIIPSKDNILKNKLFFQDKYIDYKGIQTRLNSSHKLNTDLALFEKNFNLLVNNKKIKSSVIANISENKIINGWFIVNGIIKAPLSGTVELKNKKIVSLNGIITNTKVSNGNELRKNDKLGLNFKSNNISGKYYNYSYVFKDDNDKYFEYKVEKE